jgi:uncharacterized protein (DUF58 family)
MLPEELLRRVRQIEIHTRKVVNDVLSGQYKSSFKGQGVQFSEHRLYVPGDDVRHIDWKVSARTREPLIKKYDEERELTVLLIVDVSGSENFGSTEKLKSEVVAEIGGVLAYAATHTGDKVGVLFFSGGIEKVIAPKKGRQHTLRIIRDLLNYSAESTKIDAQPKFPGTDLAGALESASRILKHSGVVFIVSDFLAEGYEIPLKRLARRHDVVAVSILDEREEDVPALGQILLFDPESGQERLVDTSSYGFKKWLDDYQKRVETGFQSALKSSRVELLRILTREDYGDAVVRFFRARSRKRR